MGFLDIVALLKAAFEFPGEVMQLVDTLRKTPEEQRQEITKAIEAESERLAKEGRPSW